jgi:hypothetical protein
MPAIVGGTATITVIAAKAVRDAQKALLRYGEQGFSS